MKQKFNTINLNETQTHLLSYNQSHCKLEDIFV